MSERFLSLNDTDVDDFIEEEENINTKKKTELDLALVNSFIFKEKENRRFKEIPPQELDLNLSKFILAVKKRTVTSMSQQLYGDLFLPSSVISRSIDTASRLSPDKILQEHERCLSQNKSNLND